VTPEQSIRLDLHDPLPRLVSCSLTFVYNLEVLIVVKENSRVVWLPGPPVSPRMGIYQTKPDASPDFFFCINHNNPVSRDCCSHIHPCDRSQQLIVAILTLSSGSLGRKSLTHLVPCVGTAMKRAPSSSPKSVSNAHMPFTLLILTTTSAFL
jgi:hypothetical protein